MFGAGLRALIVFLVICAPAYLAPGASVSAQEITLIVAGLAALFVLFEYSSITPGLVDFRYAPPYNRARFAIFAAVLLVVTFYCRAQTGADAFSGPLRVAATDIGEGLSLPLSPVSLAMSMLGSDGAQAFQDRIRDVAALSIATAIGGALALALIIWVFRWPTHRSNFNLWINMPTFAPADEQAVRRRLARNGKLMILLGAATPFYALIGVSHAADWFDPEVLAFNLPLVWGATIWAMTPALLILRGAALIKISRLIKKASG